MEKPIPLERLFKEKLFRVPDYQRGYAWRKEQLKAFWEDLVNLGDERAHYTGVLTLTEVPAHAIARDSKEYWLVDDHSYRLYHVVDGQQRLTTVVVFIQAFADFLRAQPGNAAKAPKDIYLTDTLTLADLEERYLFRTNPGGGYRTYKFGYTEDNPSQEFLRHRILGEPDGGEVEETFYTLNLANAKHYFGEQIAELHLREGMAGLVDVFKRLTKGMLFNEYVIGDEFDVFVAFETMNNRGKKLSDLELLKNRLIYLTTLYGQAQLDEAGRRDLRDHINGAWKEVYHQLGKNKSRPLNDDDFLRAHWITYFKYSRNTGKDYARFLLDAHFTPRNVHELVEKDVELEQVEEQRSDTELDDQDDAAPAPSEPLVYERSRLEHPAIRDYVGSLKSSASHWFNSWYPHLAGGMSEHERRMLDRLNRIGINYFRPLVMVILKRERSEARRLWIFERIERFLFIAFRMGMARSNYGSSEFYNVARSLDRGQVTLEDIAEQLQQRIRDNFNPDGTLRIDEFHNLLFKKFGAGSGYYGWSGLRYTLFEYEESLLAGARQRKVVWSDFLNSEKDRVSIEHVYPQTSQAGWDAAFADVPEAMRSRYNGSIGNLLLLSMSINSSLQNDVFADKKAPRFDATGRKIRNGYADGSHSEIEVATHADWGPAEIRARGLRILAFMEVRWDFALRPDDREKLLFLDATA